MKVVPLPHRDSACSTGLEAEQNRAMHQSTMVASHSRSRPEGGCCCKTSFESHLTSLPAWPSPRFSPALHSAPRKTQQRRRANAGSAAARAARGAFWRDHRSAGQDSRRRSRPRCGRRIRRARSGRRAQAHRARRGRIAAAAQPPYRITLLRNDSDASEGRSGANNLAFDPAMESEGYVLVVEPARGHHYRRDRRRRFLRRADFQAAAAVARRAARAAHGHGARLAGHAISRHHDDLSRGPFPTLEFQKHQIRVFASFKINIYSPYFEHTLLYPDHPLAAPPGSSLTPAQVAELVAYARQYHVTIVPEQEAFGHLHHVLKYELYQDKAETPHGYVLAPGQSGTLPLDQGLVHANRAGVSVALHPHWRRRNLRSGRRAARTTRSQQQGYGPVYVDFPQADSRRARAAQSPPAFLGRHRRRKPRRRRRPAQGHDRRALELFGRRQASTS